MNLNPLFSVVLSSKLLHVDQCNLDFLSVKIFLNSFVCASKSCLPPSISKSYLFTLFRNIIQFKYFLKYNHDKLTKRTITYLKTWIYEIEWLTIFIFMIIENWYLFLLRCWHWDKKYLMFSGHIHNFSKTYHTVIIKDVMFYNVFCVMAFVSLKILIGFLLSCVL